MLTDRGVEVRELIVGPITSERLRGVQLVVLNLPSMDRPPWLVSEIEAIEGFVRHGGGMIFITDHTNCYYHQYHLLPLWQRLGLIPTFETTCERNEKNLLSHAGPGWLLVRDFESHAVTDRVKFFAMQTGGRVVGNGIIAKTSVDAWADAGMAPLYGEGNPGLTGDMRWSASEETGAQGIVLARSIDRGRVVVISDQNALGDAVISYADNWRLWLNACNWAGQLSIDTQPLTIDTTITRRLNQPSSESKDERTTFDQIIGSEPNRNAQPALPLGSWQVECWEDLSGGNFRWGSTDRDQYYHWWCWLNRWCWASAHEGPSNPAPAGRVLLLVHQANLKIAQPSALKLKARFEQVLRQKGKVVVLAEPTSAGINVDKDRQQWLDACTSEWLSPSEAEKWLASAAWHDQPLVHAKMTLAGSDLVILADPSRLQNAGFTAPEVAPDAAQSKWQLELYHWLFEQP